MLIVAIVAGFLLSAAASYYLTPLVRRVAQDKSWVDDPDGGRKMHKMPVPNAGGLAIVGAFLVGLSFFAIAPLFLPAEILSEIRLPSPFIIIGALSMAAVGFYDDVRGLHFGLKFAAQIAVALLLVFAGYVVDEIFNPFSGESIQLPYWFAVTVTITWVVGAINAINLLDGMDGLASGVSVIAFGSMTAAYLVMSNFTEVALVAVVVGAIVGFLRYNFNPAEIFMGDSGSLFIGFLIGAYSISGASQANSLLALLIPIIAMGLPVIDTGLAVVRRFIERRPMFRADGDHIHHRLAKKLGLSHRNTVLILYMISVGFGIAAFLLAISDESLADNLLAPVVLLVTAMGIFVLLKSLGYLNVPKRDDIKVKRPEAHLPLDRVNGDSSQVEVAAPWDARPVPNAPLSVTESSSE